MLVPGKFAKYFAVALLALTMSLGPAIAATGTSSRGYSLPSSSGAKSPPSSSKGYAAPPAAPSTSTPSTGAPRSSNGYAAPGTGAAGSRPGAASSTATVRQSAGDAAVARQNSSSALKSYTAQREQAKFAAAPTPVAAPSPAFAQYAGRYSSYDAYYANRSSFYGGWGWTAPPYIYASRPSFGMWDALFLWFMLDSLSNASHAAWFYNHADDPGYQQWRQEANRLAADNADLRAKLDALDAKQREMEGKPRDPNYLPADVKADVALASENAVAAPSGSHLGPNWWLVIAVLVALLCAAYMWHGHARRFVHH